MSITSKRSAFTLIELIVVIAIMGTVAALVSSRLAGFAEESTVLTPVTLKNYLTAFNSGKRLDLLCYDDCTQCDLWEGDQKIRTSLALESTSSITARRFNRFGALVTADPAIHSDSDGMREGCFQFSLYPDGTTSALILGSDKGFIAYTPLSDSLITGNEEELRSMLYDTTLMTAGSYYGSR